MVLAYETNVASGRSDGRARLFVGLSILLYLASLTQNPYRTAWPAPEGQYFGGLALLLIGWVGVFGGVVAWLANPALLMAWIFTFSRYRRAEAVICALAALGLALSFLSVKEIDVDEAGNHAKIISYALGYWLWVGSIVMACAGSMVAAFRKGEARAYE